MIEFLIDLGFPPELAWQRAARHKYGWIDTSKPGDILKPSMYFHHLQEVKKLTHSQRLCLFVGKISIQDLEKYQKYSGKIPLEKIQEFYNVKMDI
jgi:hypothetical protein